MQTFSDAANYTLKFINQTNRSIFLTGKAGTGKTTLLKEIIRTTHKNTVVVAPTGIAALNAGGVTVHSMFQLPFSAFIPDNSEPQVFDTVKFETKTTLRRHFRMSGIKKSVIVNMELLIIDEVSMLRADLLDAIDFMMQSVRRNSMPFGGAQVLFIGDLLQLPPVIKDEEWRKLQQYYSGKFFFHSHVVQRNPPLYIELQKIFRQTDDRFISILNQLRNNAILPDDISYLNQFVKPDFDLKSNKGYITLTTHNSKADVINSEALEDLNQTAHFFSAEIIGDFPEKHAPVDTILELKVGAQIMFVKNDISIDKKYFNGKIGIVKSLSEGEILINFPEENVTIEVEKYEWQNIRYTVNPTTKEIEEDVLGTFVQYPIKLAWAITVHKSQGLTFDKAALDVSQVFLPGQAYVALSRLRSLNGLILLSELRMNGITNDRDVMDYSSHKTEETLLESALKIETQQFICNYLKTSFDWNDLAQQWRNHQFSYNEEALKSEKSKSATWAKNQTEVIWQLLDPARKFSSQLHHLFHGETVDFAFVLERINAAYDYFFKPLDSLVDELLWKLEEVRRVKKAKSFFDELIALEELQTKAVLRLMKAKILIETVASGLDISKETLQSGKIKSYKINKYESIREQFKNLNITLIEDEKDAERYASKKKGKKPPKKSTIDETYELWLQKLSVKEIAGERKLTQTTINGHLAKLIEARKISISELLPDEKIQQLADAFENYAEESLSALKEQHGDRFTWDELKLFRAAIQAESTD